jgi:O-antigen/teichoic acid export membrane protein
MTMDRTGGDDGVRRVVGHAGALAMSKGASSALLLGWQVLLARQLGAYQYGVYGTIAALLFVGATVPDPGVGVIHVRDAAREPARAGRYLGAALALHAPLAAVAYLVLQVSAAVLGYSTDLRQLLALAACSLVVDVIGTTAHNQLIAAERFRVTAAVTTAHVALVVSVGAAVLIGGGGLWSVYLCVIGGGIARAAALWTVLARSGVTLTWPIDLGLARHLLRAGLPLGIAATLAMSLMHADKMLTTALLGPGATGQLMTAFVIVFGIVELTGTTMLVAALPVMARMPAGDPARGLPAALHHLLVFDLVVGLPAAAVLVGFGGRLATAIFGPAYAGAGPLLQVLAWYLVVHLAEGSLAQSLTLQDRQRGVLAARACGLAVALVSTLLLLQTVGLVGAAWGMLAGDAVATAIMARVVGLPAGWWARLGGSLARLLLPAAGLFGLQAIMHGRVPPMAAAPLALTAYAALVVALGAIPRDQRAALAAMAEELPGWGATRRWMGI